MGKLADAEHYSGRHLEGRSGQNKLLEYSSLLNGSVHSFVKPFNMSVANDLFDIFHLKPPVRVKVRGDVSQ